MKPRHQVSRAAVELIKQFEGYRAKAAQLPDGRWTIGYGHTKTARSGAEVSEADAEALLLYDLIAIAHAVNEQVYSPLTQNQFDALASFAFSVGPRNFTESAVLRRVNEGAMIEAAYAIEMWRRADFEGERIVVDALVRRRAAEKVLFLTPPDGFVPAPSPILPPKLDLLALEHAPSGRAAVVTAPLEGEQTTLEREGPAAVAPEPAGSAAEAAAAAVSERLQNLLPEEPAASGASQTSGVEAPFSARFDRLSPLTFDSAPSRANPFDELRAMTTSVAPGGEPVSRNLIFWALLAGAGLIIFLGAIVWGFNAGANGDPVIPLALGWALGLLGVVCLGVAARFLLQRLGGEDVDES